MEFTQHSTTCGVGICTYIHVHTYIHNCMKLALVFLFEVVCMHMHTLPIRIIDVEFTAFLRSWSAAGSDCFVFLLPTDGQPPSRDFSSFVKKLLQVDPKQRYGNTRGPGQGRRGCHCCPGGCMYVCMYVCMYAVKLSSPGNMFYRTILL